MPTKFNAWSYSRYSDYKNCPRKAKYRHLDKLPTKPNPALAKGLAAHKAIERYIKREVPTLVYPDTGHPVAKGAALTLIDTLRTVALGLVQVEAEWAFKGDWSPTHWRDWNECACRVKIDASYDRGEGELRVYDWKTGKKRKENHEDYIEQLDLYALGALLMLPRVKVVVPQLVYLDSDEVYPDEPAHHTRQDVDTLMRSWAKRTEQMLKDEVFIPRPNHLCRWCDYRKEVGGPCEF